MNTRTITDITHTQILEDAELLFADMPEHGDQDAERIELERLELPIWAQDQLNRLDLEAASGS